ncbi:MAG: DMT family transporter [Candidatus Thermoplasmatota archaeon]|nr:DMT family transporter [Candidatus Thermoplasmatota archaeon]
MVIGAVLIWAASYPLIKIALGDVTPILLGALRHLIFIPLLGILFLKSGKNIFTHSKIDWILFIGIGLFAIALPNILQNIGMLYTTASLSSIIQSSGPMFTLFLAVIFLKESLGAKKILGALLALFGAVMLVTGGQIQFTGTFYGNFLILLSGLSYSISGIITKKALERHSPFVILSYGIMIGFVVLACASLITEPVASIKFLPIHAWVVILLLALFPSFIASWLWYKVLISAELSKLVLFIYLMPVFAVGISYLMLRETIGYDTVLFAALVIGGIALAQKG